MTLCISYKYRTLDDGTPTAFCYADSLLTTLGPKDRRGEKGAFLPSNAEIRHQTPRGIKIHTVSASVGEKRSSRGFVFSIAGAVPLGLQSLIHLDSVFKTLRERYSFEEYISHAEKTLRDFWQHAWDKDIEYLITACDDHNETRIFHLKGTESDLITEEVQLENGLLFAVIGDGAEKAREWILRETNSLVCAGFDIYSSLDTACIRMMRRAIEDPTQIFIGGSIQSASLRGWEARYLTVDDGNQHAFRGVEYPVEYENLINRAPFPITYVCGDIYDPQLNIGEIVPQLDALWERYSN